MQNLTNDVIKNLTCFALFFSDNREVVLAKLLKLFLPLILSLGFGALTGCQTVPSINTPKQTQATVQIESAQPHIDDATQTDTSSISAPSQQSDIQKPDVQTIIVDLEKEAQHSESVTVEDNLEIFQPVPDKSDYDAEVNEVLTEPQIAQQPHSPVMGSEAPQNQQPSKIVIIEPLEIDPEEHRRQLLEQARQHSNGNTTRPSSTLNNGDNIPAFRQLMDTGIKQLQQGQLSEAESSFTRAQRLAPQSSAVYFYLGQVALKKNQPIKAEAMARRGLSVAQSRSRKVVLWQLILRSAQSRGHQPTILEANRALASL